MLFTGLKHTHQLLVVLFLLSILIKLILLFTNSAKFDVYRDKTKKAEMWVTILFLVLGIVMAFMKEGQFHTLFWVKLGMIGAAIPITIIGFKKKNKILSMLGVFVFIMSYGVSEMAAKRGVSKTAEVSAEQAGTVDHGKMLYDLNCALCHGEAGNKQLDGAADLSKSTLNESEISAIIQNGKGSMPSFGSLTEEEKSAISLYVKSLAGNQQ